MTVILRVTFLAGRQDGLQGCGQLRIDDLPFAPFPGLEFEHLVWKAAKKVVNVTWSVEDERFFVVLEDDNIGTPDQCESHKEMYRSHGWAVDSEPQ